MLPVNSRLSNKIAANFYYSATKRCLSGSNQGTSNTTSINSITRRHRSASVKNKYNESVTESPQLASTYFDQFPNYCQMITDAKSRARRSVLIDHCGLENIDLKSEFSNVEHVYSIEKETRRGLTKLSLIEFKTENDAENVARQARHNDGELPVSLKILRFYPSTSERKEYDYRDLPFNVENVKLSFRRELSTEFTSYSELLSCNMMSMIDLKMRFITLINFERVLCAGMFDEYELMPFGSSVIDMGCESGDLDIVLTRKDNHHQYIEDLLNNPKRIRQQQSKPSKLVHLDKSLNSEARDPIGIRNTMRWFDYLLRDYMPLTTGNNVVFVRYAKVPIIKFTSLVTGLDCDLSFNFGLDYREQDVLATNYSGIVMSQLLYSICRANNLFSSVATYLRLFGRLTSITSKSPGIGLTNFQFLSLILFYLQQISVQGISFSPQSNHRELASLREGNIAVPDRKLEFKIRTRQNNWQNVIVPPFKHLLNFKQTNQRDSMVYRFTDEQLNKLLPEVIMGFFRFYSNFDFVGSSLDLYTGRIDRKLDNSSVYVVNPLDKSRNVCHNVNRKGLERFIEQVRLASRNIQSNRETPLSLMRNLMMNYQTVRRKTPLEVFDLRGDGIASTAGDIAHDMFSEEVNE